MTDILDDLEAKAEAASKGDWRSGSTWTRSIFSGVSYLGDTKRPEDASYIAAANPTVIKDLISRCRKAEAEVERLGNNIIGLEACKKIYQHDVEVHLLKPRDEEIARLKADVERLRGLLAEASESMRMSLSEFDYRKTQSASFSDPRWVDAARSISTKIEEALK